MTKQHSLFDLLEEPQPLEPERPELDAPSDRHLPHHGVNVARSLESGERVTLHFWFYRSERELTIDLSTPGLSLDRLCLRIKRPAERVNFFLPWSDVFYVEAAAADNTYSHFIDPARLYDMPLKLARELLEGCSGECRESYELRDSLQRALAKPHLFNRIAYTPFSWETKRRQEDTVLALREVSDAPHELPVRGPWCPDYGAKRVGVHDPDYLDSLSRIGVSVRADGRFMVDVPLQGPVRPEGPGAGSIGYWRLRLLELEFGRHSVNGVPINKLACDPVMYEVGRFSYTVEAGLGTGARLPHTETLDIHDAAERVWSGRYAHHQYCASTGRWHESAV